jgi:subtilisin family serine protease
MFNITVVNMSLGDDGNYDTTNPFPMDSLRNKVNALRLAGVAVVVSAGNGFYSHNSQQGMSYPAIFPESVSVGAVYDADIGGPYTYSSGAVAHTTGANRLCPFSQRLFRTGDSDTGLTTGTDVFAPGAAVRSTGIQSDDGYSILMHGTSQSAPATAGLIVLMQEYHLRLTQTAVNDTGVLPSVDDIETWLRRGALPVNDGDDEDDNVTNTTRSFRRVDAIGALNAITNQIQNELINTRAATISDLPRIKALKQQVLRQ